MKMKNKTTYLMHTACGDVATIEQWENDFKNMDIEPWFGLPAEQCEGLHWINDNVDSGDCDKKPFLVEVIQNEQGEWIEKE